MSEEQDEQLLNLLFQTNLQLNQQVRLHLYKPRLNHHKLTCSDLFQFQTKYPILKKFTLQPSDIYGQQNAILSFSNVQDILDFQLQQKQHLTYSMALVSSSQNQLNQKTTHSLNQPSKLQQQIDDQGFDLINGSITIKRATSLQYIVDQDSNCLDQQSTLVHTQRKISIDDQFQPQIEKISHHICKQINVNYQPQHKITIKPVVDGLLLTSMILGGFKLIKYFVKI